MSGASPAEVLDALPEPCAALVRAVLAVADRRGEPVYLVGGPVRDFLLSRPLRDVDLLVVGRDVESAAKLAHEAAPRARVVVHERFGTVSVAQDDVAIDLSSVRRERYAHDGALPSVETGTLEEDLLRRDFSVNALALPLSEAARAASPGIVDCDEGRSDLEKKRLRVLHPRSFHDDPTRALRAARLAARLGFTLTRGSRTALRDALRDGAFGRVSGERLRREVEKLFDDAALGLDPARALRLLDDWHVLGALEPGLALPRQAAAPLRRVGRAVAKPPWPAGRWRPFVAGLAVWLAPLPPSLRRRALRRLAVRGERATQIERFPRSRDTWLRAVARARGRGAVDAVLCDLGEELLVALHACAEAPARRRIARWAIQDRSRRTPVSGADLTAVGLEGPAVGRALRRIRDAYLDGAVGSRDEALALARELARRRPAQRRAAKTRRTPPS